PHLESGLCNSEGLSWRETNQRERLAQAVIIIAEEQGVLAMCEDLAMDLAILDDGNRAGVECVEDPVVDVVVDVGKADDRSRPEHSSKRPLHRDALLQPCRTALGQIARRDVGLKQHGKLLRNLEDMQPPPQLNGVRHKVNAIMQQIWLLDEP